MRVGGRSVNLQLSLNKAQFRRPQLSEKKPFVGGGVDTVCCSSSLCSSVGGLPHGFSSFQDQNIVRPAHGFCFTKLRSSDFTLWNVFFLVSSLGLFKKPQDETPRQVAPTPPSGTRSHWKEKKSSSTASECSINLCFGNAQFDSLPKPPNFFFNLNFD